MKLDDGLDLEKQSLDMTPLIDIIFLLVLFFAVSTSFISGEDLEKLKRNLVDSTSDRETLDLRLNAAQTEALKSSEEAELLRLLLEKEQTKTQTLEQSAQDSSIQNEQLAANLAVLQGLLNNKTEEFELEQQGFASKLANSNADLESALQSIDALNQELARQEKEFLDSKSSIDAEAVLLQKLVAERAAEISNLEIRLTQAEEARVLLDSELKSVQLAKEDEIKQLTEQQDSLKADSASNEETIKRLQAQLSDSRETIQLLDTELEKFRILSQADRVQLEKTLEAQQSLKSGLSDYLESNSLGIVRDGNNITLQLSNKILFSSGSADLKPEGLEVLANLGRELSEQLKDLNLEVGGHTDSVPINTASTYTDNWGLSVARAVNVVRFFESSVGLDPENMSALGFGQYRPVADNSSADGRALNRRIEIVLVPRPEQE